MHKRNKFVLIALRCAGAVLGVGLIATAIANLVSIVHGQNIFGLYRDVGIFILVGGFFLFYGITGESSIVRYYRN